VATDDKSAQVQELRSSIQGLSDTNSLAAPESASVASAVGVAPLEGPGLSVTLSDATQNSGRSASDTQLGKVLDVDVQSVVNALWSAGAQGIAVNSQRITSLSAIRSAGDTVKIWRQWSGPRLANSGTELWSGFDYFHDRFIASCPGQCGVEICHPCAWIGDELVIAALGLIIGAALGLFLQPDIPLWLQPYLPIAIVAGLDALFGALRALLDGIFSDRVFVISFVSNVLIAALIVFVGDQLGVGAQLSTGVVVVLTIRIFANVAAIRRKLFHG
jgi:small basic protein